MNRTPKSLSRLALTAGSLTLAFALAGACLAMSGSSGQGGAELFATPEAAVQAFQAAMKSGDKDTLRKIFGTEVGELTSGDDVQDKADFEKLAEQMAVSTKLEADGDARRIVAIGADEWPFPIPIVKDASGKWYFDTDAGKEEIVNRRVGENELATILVCREYARAQREYASQDRDGDEVLEFAQRLMSTPGKQDGLYWDSKPDEEGSPFGPLVAFAQGVGYEHGKQVDAPKPQPFYGYLYRIVTTQGANVPGGKYDYVINGNMIGGFALVAYPVEYGKSGIMTFVVNQQGKVWQKDLGDKTAELAGALTVYDPDKTWTRARD